MPELPEEVPDLQRVRRIDALAAAAWPAEEVASVDGWRLRWNRGVYRRACSVWPNEPAGALALEERLAAADAFYVRRGAPTRYHVCPAARPGDLDARLAARGLRIEAPTLVVVAGASELRARAQERGGPATLSVSVRREPPADWLETWIETAFDDAERRAVAPGLLGRIGARAIFALARAGETPGATALAVPGGAAAGIFAVRVAPALRGRGAARALLVALAEHAERDGARELYAQVEVGNAAARTLYTSIGFETLYRYHYRLGPRPPPAGSATRGTARARRGT